MNKVELLKNRIERIGDNLSKKDHALGLVALGSIGAEQERLDQFSDLDFYAIVQDGTQKEFLDSLDWLDSESPLVYSFLNTKDGYKILYQDGVYGEFAVFEKSDLTTVIGNPGRIIWEREQENLPTSFINNTDQNDADYYFNEALTNIYVGLSRYRRGEKLSGWQFINEHAFESLLKTIPLTDSRKNEFVDTFNVGRRFEQHYPDRVAEITSILGDYSDVVVSAKTALQYIEKYYKPNQQLVDEINKLL